MRHSKRHADILKLVRDEGTTEIATLARRLGVSQETIRRDVRPLTESGQLLKMHGAVAMPQEDPEAPFERRLRENAEAKRAIAMHAAGQIVDGDSVMLDTGTTTSLLARALLGRRHLTVVTNSSDIARTLATVNGNTVYMAGGELHGDNGAAFGPSAIAFVERFRVRHAIISIGAIDPEVGPMDYSLAEAEFARVVLSRGRQATLVTDCSKFGRSGLVKVCDFADIDVMVTDALPEPDLVERLREASVAIEVAQTAADEGTAQQL